MNREGKSEEGSNRHEMWNISKTMQEGRYRSKKSDKEDRKDRIEENKKVHIRRRNERYTRVRNWIQEMDKIVKIKKEMQQGIARQRN